MIISLLFSFGDDNEISHKNVSELLRKDALESITIEIRKYFPEIAEILISERDQYMAYMIKEAPGEKIVAILGGAHVKGVRDEIFKTQDINKLSEVPPKSLLSRIIGWVIPIIIAGLIIYSFVMNLETGIHQLSAWVLWTGVLAALFTALSFGHPLSILTSLVAAPFTTLNPLIACGWLTGLVEATIRKPVVQDINNISKDIFTIKGFFKNRFLKVILIVIMANIGSSIGSFIAGLDIVKTLFRL